MTDYGTREQRKNLYQSLAVGAFLVGEFLVYDNDRIKDNNYVIHPFSNECGPNGERPSFMTSKYFTDVQTGQYTVNMVLRDRLKNQPFKHEDFELSWPKRH